MGFVLLTSVDEADGWNSTTLSATDVIVLLVDIGLDHRDVSASGARGDWLLGRRVAHALLVSRVLCGSLLEGSRW